MIFKRNLNLTSWKRVEYWSASDCASPITHAYEMKQATRTTNRNQNALNITKPVLISALEIGRIKIIETNKTFWTE